MAIEIKVSGEPKEVAALVLELQRQRLVDLERDAKIRECTEKYKGAFAKLDRPH